jgi:hypothetical protein
MFWKFQGVGRRKKPNVPLIQRYSEGLSLQSLTSPRTLGGNIHTWVTPAYVRSQSLLYESGIIELTSQRLSKKAKLAV